MRTNLRARRAHAREERAAAVRSVRPRLAVLWAAALLGVTLVLSHPAALAGLLVGVLVMGWDLGASAELRRLLAFAVPFAAVLLVVQVLIDRNGLTVIARLGDAGPLGELDVTLEAVLGAATQVLRVLAGLAVSALALALVDTDRVLASVRRRAPATGVTAILALRLAPAIADDGRRYADGLRCRAGGSLAPADRARVVSAVLGRTVDRAGDAAAILELRGLARPAPRRPRSAARWSLIERASACGAALLVAGATAALGTGAERFSTSPAVHGASGFMAAVIGVGLALLACAPLARAAR